MFRAAMVVVERLQLRVLKDEYEDDFARTEDSF